MRLELEREDWKYLAIAIVFLSIGAAAGYTANGQPENEVLHKAECPVEMKLTEADQNLVIAAGLTGHCEKLGLQPSIMVQDFNGTPYGVPICTERGTG